MSSPEESIPTEATSATLTVARLLSHMKKPENLLTWLVLTAWMKWMGVAQHLPSITVG